MSWLNFPHAAIDKKRKIVALARRSASGPKRLTAVLLAVSLALLHKSECVTARNPHSGPRSGWIQLDRTRWESGVHRNRESILPSCDQGRRNLSHVVHGYGRWPLPSSTYNFDRRTGLVCSYRGDRSDGPTRSYSCSQRRHRCLPQLQDVVWRWCHMAFR